MGPHGSGIVVYKLEVHLNAQKICSKHYNICSNFTYLFHVKHTWMQLMMLAGFCMVSADTSPLQPLREPDTCIANVDLVGVNSVH